MTKEYFQTIVQFSVDTETKQVDILRHFTMPMRESQTKKRKKKAPTPLVSKTALEEFM